MTMAVENQHRFGSGMNFDHLPYSNTTQFTNPWTSSTSPPQNHSLYAPHHNLTPNLAIDVKPQPRRLPGNVPLGSFNHVPITTSATANTIETYASHQLLSSPQDILNTNRPVSNNTTNASSNSSTTSNAPYEQAYSTAPASVQHTFTNHSPYESLGYGTAPVRSNYAIHPPDNSRRPSKPPVSSSHLSPNSEEARRIHRLNSPIDFHDSNNLSNQPRSYSESIDSSRALIAMNQGVNSQSSYGHGRIRGSGDSYGYPGGISHSSSSSISSSGTFPSYYSGSVDSNIGEYTTNGLPGSTPEIEAMSSRTLPRPPNISTSSVPPAPQSMMGQFNSKASTNTQKKHKCKVCDKRFTRPSSLQTHMYSHTGEKLEGCGRHFSVVSNLRRHRKVHKGEARSETGSEAHQSDE